MTHSEIEFSAFISYRHLDTVEPGRQWAVWVQNVLERYTTPPELAGQPSLYGDPVPVDMARVFRDKDQVPAHGDLGTLIHEALERSRVLIVLCTPTAVTSPWVSDEILHFKKLGRGDRIIAIVLRGKPHALDPAEECFPEPLRCKLLPDGTLDRSQKEQPIYIDLRPPLGVDGGTTPEEYRAILQQADEWKDTRIDQAVQKYGQQLEEARILLLSGALGLAPRDLSQRDLLRQIEEEKQRATAAAQRAAWEAEQKEIAETARAEAEAARLEAETARKEAEAALAATESARRQADQSREAAERDQRAAEQARVDEQRQREAAQRSRKTARILAVVATALTIVACTVAVWAYIMRAGAERERQNAVDARQKAVVARQAADAFTVFLRYELIWNPATGLSHSAKKTINEHVAEYFEKHPPSADDPPEVWHTYDRERSVMFFEAGELARMDNNMILAREKLAQSSDLRRKLVKIDPTNIDWRRLVTISLDCLAKVDVAEHRRDDAFARITEALQIRQMIADQHSDALFQIDLADMYARLALHHLEGTPPDKVTAEKLLTASFACMQAIKSKEGQEDYFQRGMAELESVKRLLETTQ